MIDSSVDYGASNNKLEKEQEIYKRQALLGTGSFGKAYLVRQIKTDLPYVIKQVSMADMSTAEQEAALREAKILEALSHPNIVKFKEVYRTSKKRLNIVMEYADGGDLAAKIKKAKKEKVHFEESQILDWFTQICLAIKHCHDRKIIHRDIKAQNVFLTTQNCVKIGDFGVSKVLERTVMNAKTVVGTPYYCSPEILQNKPYSFQTDVWSLGALLYELCALEHPFTANNLQFLALKIVKGSYGQIPDHYSYEMKLLIKSMLNTDSSRRPNINRILTSKIMSKRISNFLTESKRMDQFSHTVIHNKDILERQKRMKLNKDGSQFRSPPNLMKIQQEMGENKSEIYSSKQNYGNQPPSPEKSRPFTPVVSAVKKKGPNNFFNRKQSTKQIPEIPQNNSNSNLSDIMTIKATALEQKTKLPRVTTNPSFFDKNQVSELKSNRIIGQKEKIVPPQPPINAFGKNPAKKIEGATNEVVIGKWKKPLSVEKNPSQVSLLQIEKPTPKLSQNGKVEGEKKVGNVAISKGKPLKKVDSKAKLNNGKNKSISTNAIKPNRKVSVANNPTNKKGESEKPSVKRQGSKEHKIEIVSEQVKKKVEEEKKLSKQNSSANSKKQFKKNTGNIRMGSAITKKQSTTNKTVIKSKIPKANNTPNSSMSNGFKEKLSKPPTLEYETNDEENHEMIHSVEEGQKQQNLPTNGAKQTDDNFSVQEEQKCNSENNLSQKQDSEGEYSYYNDDFEDEVDGDQNKQSEEQIEDDLEEKLSLTLSDSAHPNKLKGLEIPQIHKENYNKMLGELQNIQKMVAEANGMIDNLPMFGEEIPSDMLLTQKCISGNTDDVRQDDSDLDSVVNDGSTGNVTSPLSSTKTDNSPANNLKCLSNQGELESLRMNLEDLFGEEDIIFIHSFISDKIDKEGLDFNEKKVMAELLLDRGSINRILLEKYFRLIVTVICMEQEICSETQIAENY